MIGQQDAAPEPGEESLRPVTVVDVMALGVRGGRCGFEQS